MVALLAQAQVLRGIQAQVLQEELQVVALLALALVLQAQVLREIQVQVLLPQPQEQVPQEELQVVALLALALVVSPNRSTCNKLWVIQQWMTWKAEMALPSLV
ncbi:hypothetical protein AVDCRST_MAG81-1249 [uncultured Synechococcales cyanobacterium]|uniref:Uncharacterized protein n=1 Tax=uncultured Synechococcales cyanobacterium TaxID=1936017 RepID=A0A6J4V378_9CYAN|nr:hypothetical protein AVDCRST_MAG81-1249 [uncultured Synechococcales cyanobacterium]